MVRERVQALIRILDRLRQAQVDTDDEINAAAGTE
jgi:hypothetical protein